MTFKEAVELWINRDFNCISREMIEPFIEKEGASKFIMQADGCVIEDDAFTINEAWSFVFQPKNSIDADWIEKHYEEVCRLGFSVYLTTQNPILAIDGGGYDFYEGHWNKLYKLIGLQWHDEEE